jgi:serine/threonine protein kinase
MAPELFINANYIPKYVDIFAMGVCLFYILTKKFPCHFKANTTDKLY